MRTQAQSDASRANGAQSHGPVTDAGKARSSQNALKLGLFSRCVVLANESQDLYDQLLERNRSEWRPQGESENHLLLEMVNAAWRLRRIWSWNTAAIDTEMFMQRTDFDASFSNHHPGMRGADAFLALAAHNPSAIASMLRAETTYSRAYRRAQDGLIKLQRLRGLNRSPKAPIFEPEPAAPPETSLETPPLHNEPKPQSLLQLLLAIILTLASLLNQRDAAPPSDSGRNIDATLEPEPETTFQLPETFHWESVFTPTPKRPTVDTRDWSQTQ